MNSKEIKDFLPMQTNGTNDLTEFIETLLNAGISVDCVAKIAMDYASADTTILSVSTQSKMLHVAHALYEIMQRREQRVPRMLSLPATGIPNGLIPFKRQEGDE